MKKLIFLFIFVSLCVSANSQCWNLFNRYQIMTPQCQANNWYSINMSIQELGYSDYGSLVREINKDPRTVDTVYGKCAMFSEYKNLHGIQTLILSKINIIYSYNRLGKLIGSRIKMEFYNQKTAFLFAFAEISGERVEFSMLGF